MNNLVAYSRISDLGAYSVNAGPRYWRLKKSMLLPTLNNNVTFV